MPRNSSGNYVLPTGNPVVADTLIESAWANSTMEDIAEALTDSLDRNGRGGMLAPFRLADGVLMEPGLSFANEPSLGLFRAAANDMRATVLGVPRMRWTAANGTQNWDGSAWRTFGTAAYATLTTANADGTAERVTRIGDFGLGGRGVSLDGVDADVDMDNVTLSGFYRLTAGTLNAYPGQQSGDTAIMVSWSSTFAAQVGFNRGGTVWSRYNNNGTWTAWQRLTNTTDVIPAGTRMLFQQAAAPTGWVRDTAAAMNNRALRLVTGTVGSGGSVAFTTVFGSARATTSSGAHTHTITVNNHTLTLAQTPARTGAVTATICGSHGIFTGGSGAFTTSNNATNPAGGCNFAGTYGRTLSYSSGGSGSAHNHTASSNSTGAHTHTSNLDVQYVDLLVATKS